jgi:hypothetical protein
MLTSGADATGPDASVANSLALPRRLGLTLARSRHMRMLSTFRAAAAGRRSLHRALLRLPCLVAPLFCAAPALSESLKALPAAQHVASAHESRAIVAFGSPRSETSCNDRLNVGEGGWGYVRHVTRGGGGFPAHRMWQGALFGSADYDFQSHPRAANHFGLRSNKFQSCNRIESWCVKVARERRQQASQQSHKPQFRAIAR